MEINLFERQRRRSQVKCGRVNLRHCVGECVRTFSAYGIGSGSERRCPGLPTSQWLYAGTLRPIAAMGGLD